MISSGVALASRGELRFNLVGFLTQAAAVGVRAFPRKAATRSQLTDATLVRSVAPGNDPNIAPRPQDGPTRVIALLRARVRAYQPRDPPIHRGLCALL